MKIPQFLGCALGAALLVGIGSTFLAHAETFSGTARVIDGDSLHVGDTEVRLYAVDAFEGKQTCTRGGAAWACGEAAANKLRSLTSGRTITCTKKDTDSYGRTVAVCSNGSADLGAELASAGLALAYRQYGSDYVDEETAARAARRGAWAGEFTAPWDERHGATSSTVQRRSEGGNNTAPQSSCRSTGIKGNINGKGDHIYHVPGSSSYAETVIDESKGERWFCTEDEARRAGWRPPRGG
ncbi:MAG TPA: thermonuclease family protein [Gammaproteobacteria bacterium]|nr:thermonuclease family protein [Gammaproteobacteria bacterium]